MSYNRVNKYKAQKVTIDGFTFASKAEGAYYRQLKMLGLEYTMQEKFEVIAGFTLNGKRYSARSYKPDFCIYEDGKLVKVVDVKGGNATVTTDSKLRMILFMVKYKIPITVARYDYRTGRFEEKQL